jgi:antitoxin component HigA of HigAB toxin-antitoxin module
MNNLVKQVKVYKSKYSEAQNENKYLRALTKTTQLTEVKIENELYKKELIRLRSLLEKEIGNKMTEAHRKATDKPTQNVRVYELENMLH